MATENQQQSKQSKPQPDQSQRGKERRVLLKLLQQILDNLQAISQRGAGYYTVTPHIEKYNKLLAKARELFPNNALMDTFDPIEDRRYTDPSDKEKQSQRVILEVSQLIAFVQAVMQEEQSNG